MLAWLIQLVILQTPEESRHFLKVTLSVFHINQLTPFTWVLSVHIHHLEHSVKTERASHQNRLPLGRCRVCVTLFHSKYVLKITISQPTFRGERGNLREYYSLLSLPLIGSWVKQCHQSSHIFNNTFCKV